MQHGSTRTSEGVWAGMCFLFKKDILKDLGNFDERFYIYGQDSEFAYRALKSTGTIIREDVWVHHIGSYSWDKENEKGAVDKEADRTYARHLYIKLTIQEGSSEHSLEALEPSLRALISILNGYYN